MAPRIPPVSLSSSAVAHVRVALKHRLECSSRATSSNWRRVLQPYLPQQPDEDLSMAAEQEDVSRFAASTGISLADLVRSRRGETRSDPRPNKALDPHILAQLLQGYPLVGDFVAISVRGILPSWTIVQPRNHRPPKNHKSAVEFHPSLLRSIRQGQSAGTYLVVNQALLDKWPSVQCSPFGAVEKKGVDPSIEIRPIHDLSFPVDASTNDHLDPASVPEVAYSSVAAIARRIEQVARANPGVAVKIMKGDVKSAYRHLIVHADHINWIGATLPQEEALVFDLAAPFGWSGSPAFYSVFGRAISWLVASNSSATVTESSDNEAFFGYEWVDDHILVELDRGNRLELASATLRLSMMAVLGPESINESKFSEWDVELQALGLVWTTADLIVSMPREKICKCLGRVRLMLSQESDSKWQLQQLLGSLRHLSSCLRSAKPFYQHLNAVCSVMLPFGQRHLSESARRAFQWFRYILEYGRFEKLPLRYFGFLLQPDIHLYLDASDSGLAVLYLDANEFIQLRFDAEEATMIQSSVTSGFTINVREHLCMALAALCWGPKWQLTGSLPHIACWSDNVSAVAWNNRMSSHNSLSREINRAIGLAEAVFNIRLSAAHLLGKCNHMADAGSRAWSAPHSSLWCDLSAGWLQVAVPAQWRKIYSTFSANCSPSH